MSSLKKLSNTRKRKNVFLEACLNDKGEHFWKLKDLRDNSYDPNFNAFQKYLRDQGLSLRTRKRYSEVLTMHLDYLIERGVYGNAVQDGVTSEVVDDVIRDYIHLLAKGSKTTDKKLKKISEELFIVRISGSTFGSVKSALNHFYRFNARRTIAARQRMKRVYKDLPHEDEYNEVIIGINHQPSFSENEKKALRQVSMLGGVLRWHGEITRPRSLPAPKRGRSFKREVEPLRLSDVLPLLEKATCYRDRLLWLGLMVGGPRPSELVQCRINDIDLENKQIYIPSLEEVQVSVPLNDEEKIRFKGRNIRKLWLLPEPFKSELFKTLRLYMLHEYVPNQGHDFIFQYLKNERNDSKDSSYNRGDPYYRVTAKSMNDSFRGAIKRAGIKSPDRKPNKEWSIYSCRHFYADYLLNEIKDKDGKRIFLIDDVQLCIGHEDRKSTENYARERQEAMELKFMAVDTIIHKSEVTMENLVSYHAKNLRDQASKLESKIDTGKELLLENVCD